MAGRPPRLDYSSSGGRQFEGIQAAFDKIGDASITNGRAIEVSLTTSAQNIRHGLGKTYQGWFFIKKSAACDAFQTASSDDSRYLNLTGTAAATVTIWVF